MKKTIALILAMLLSLSLFAGCAPQQSTTASESTETAQTQPAGEQASSETAAPAEGRDTLNVSIAKVGFNCDGQAFDYVEDRRILFQIYEGLVDYDDLNGEVVCKLAESYDVSDDGTQYTFHLRQDVKFHNGEPMKSSDVVFSLKRAMQPEILACKYLSFVESVEASDDYTVTVTLSEPYAPFLSNLCWVFIYSEKEVTEQGNAFGTQAALAGTGPYYIAEMDANVKIVLKAFPDYYLGEASIKTINFTVFTDSDAGMIAFESGELDWYPVGSAEEFERINETPGFTGEAVVANHVTFLVVNPATGNEALKDERVRQAIAYAFNKEDLNYAAFSGYAAEADFMDCPLYEVASPKGGDKYEYNPEKAKELLAEAGYADGVDCGVLMTYNTGYYNTVATAMQSQLADVGITVQIELTDLAAGLARIRQNTMDYDMSLSGYSGSGDYDNVRTFIDGRIITNSVDYTAAGYDQDYINTTIDKAATTADPAERSVIYEELHNYINKTATQLPLLHKSTFFVWNDQLHVVNRTTYPRFYEFNWNA